MIERSNLQQAVPMTFCYKAAVWLAGVKRHRQRLVQLKPRVVCSEAVKMVLAPEMGRETAQDALSSVCTAVANGEGSLIDLMTKNSRINKVLDPSQLEKLIDPNNYLGSSGEMADRVLAAVRPRSAEGGAAALGAPQG